MKKLILTLLIGMVCFVPMPMLAADDLAPFVPADENAGELDINLGTESPYIVASRIINIVLGLMGIFVLVLMIWGGFTWMNARGNEEEVKKAKKILEGAIIGLIIVLSSLGISQYVFNNLVNITTG